MGHGHTQYARGIFLKEVPDFAIALEFVVVGCADLCGRRGVDGDERATDRRDRDHVMGEPLEGLLAVGLSERYRSLEGKGNGRATLE